MSKVPLRYYASCDGGRFVSIYMHRGKYYVEWGKRPVEFSCLKDAASLFDEVVSSHVGRCAK